MPSHRIDASDLQLVDIEAASRLLSGTAFNAALWVAASDEPQIDLPKAIEAFRLMAKDSSRKLDEHAHRARETDHLQTSARR